MSDKWNTMIFIEEAGALGIIKTPLLSKLYGLTPNTFHRITIWDRQVDKEKTISEICEAAGISYDPSTVLHTDQRSGYGIIYGRNHREYNLIDIDLSAEPRYQVPPEIRYPEPLPFTNVSGFKK